MVKKANKHTYYGSCDPMKEGNEGIWFDEEDPKSEFYKPECCSNIYVDIASGKFELDCKRSAANYIKYLLQDIEEEY